MSSTSSSSSSTDIRRSLTIQISEIAEYVIGRTQGYRVRVEVTEAQLMPPEVFVYQRNGSTTPPSDDFSNVASPSDLEEYPITEPDTEGIFFRLSYVDLIYRNIDLLNQSVADIQSDIQSLLESLAILDAFGSPQTVTITGDYDPLSPTTEVVRAVVALVDPTVDDDAAAGYAVGSWWVNTNSGEFFVLTDNTTGAAVWLSNISTGAPTPTKLDQDLVPAPTSGDDSDTGITLSLPPTGRALDVYVMVFVNGIKHTVGDGVKTKSCFFSESGSAPHTAKPLADLTLGDKLIWNGVVAGQELVNDDVIDIYYVSAG